jgi:hypothetical protein
MSDKSDYETLRARNIERNNARLCALGLISALEEKRSNAAAWGIRVVEEEENSVKDKKGSDEEWQEFPRRKRPRETISSEVSRKKSRRLQGIAPEGGKVVVVKDTQKERENRVRECRQVRLQAAKAIADARAELAAKENPTATYEHCLMRVKSMTEKALANRVKTIERAAGKHCVVKMAIFKSCLQDENMWDLAKLASDALERLKVLQQPPED